MARRPTTGPRSRGQSPGSRAERRPALVGTLLAETHATTARRAGLGVDRVVWAEVVGERIARRTAPGPLKHGVLTVVVESPVWAQELSLLSSEILGRLTERGIQVGAIRFRTGHIGATAQRANLAARPLPAPLPEDVQQHLEAVEDESLRSLIATAVSHSLANAERQKRTVKPKPGARGPRPAAGRSDPSDPSARPRAGSKRRSRE